MAQTHIWLGGKAETTGPTLMLCSRYSFDGVSEWDWRDATCIACLRRAARTAEDIYVLGPPVPGAADSLADLLGITRHIAWMRGADHDAMFVITIAPAAGSGSAGAASAGE